MNNLLTAAASLSVALAAFLMPRAAVAAGPVDWTGPYGGLAGGVVSSGKLDLRTSGVPTAVFKDLQGTGESVNRGGVKGLSGSDYGLFAGWRFAPGAILYGVEVGWSHLGAERTVFDDVSCANANLCATDDRFATRVSSLVTATGSVGLEVGHALVTARAGLAAADYRLRVTDDNVNVFGATSSGLNDGFAADSRWVPGLLLGVGAEYRLSPRLSLGAGYDYVRFDTARFDAQGTGRCSTGTTAPLCAGRIGQTVAGDYPLTLRDADLHRFHLRVSYLR